MTGLCLPCLCRIAPLPSVIAPLAVLLCECVWGAGAVTGKGAKDVLTDQQAANILARITPSLKDEDYDKVYVTQPLQSAALIIDYATPADLVDDLHQLIWIHSLFHSQLQLIWCSARL